jgi:lipid-A-disaccharide synthase
VREILFVAGEASGDLHTARVAAALRALRPDLRAVGVGGGEMRGAGVDIVQDYEELAVMGFVEVLRHIPKHAALLRSLRARMRSGSVAGVVVVDYPGFNMKVAAAAREAGIPVLYFITPQVWAWGAGRLPKLAKLIDRAAVILPFEEPLLRGYGIDAHFVGHPLLDRAIAMPTREEARARLGIGAGEEVLVVFPGSRRQEIARHLEPFVATARAVQERRPDVRVLVHAAPTVELREADVPFPVIRGGSFEAFRAADAAMCKSGTTTLEAAVAGCPMVVAYRAGALSYAIARRVVRIPYIGLVNVVAGREVAPEFVQDALDPPRVANELVRLLTDPAHAAAQRTALAEVRGKLGTPGAARRVAEMIGDLAG